jgi:hypothetical protein
MELETGKDYYEELESAVSYEVKVNDAGRFIEAMLRFFSGKGTLYISSYDFGYWANSLAGFRSGEKVKLKTALPDGAFLQGGFAVTDEFIYVFLIDCLKNIDARTIFNQFLIYQKGMPLLQCCGNFEDVYVNAEVPQSAIKSLKEKNIIASWEGQG